MTPEAIADVLRLHAAWLAHDPLGRDADLSDADLSDANLSDANLRGANLRGANLSDADLSDANLSDADLSGAKLRGANLRGADLSGAKLRGANLSGAKLRGANLRGANLSGADLSGTCLAPALTDHARAFCRACPADADGYRIVYRTATSQHIGSTHYEPGQTYTAMLSWDVATACHPGIYAGSLEWIRNIYPTAHLVRCRVQDGEWTITAKGCIRCARIEVLDYVPQEE
jgi:hypothetical protein